MALSTASGQDSSSSVYKLNWDTDKYTMGIGAGILIGSYFVDRELTVITEADVNNLSRDDVFAWDRVAIGQFSESASSLSDVFRDGILLAPVALMLGKRGRKEWQLITYMYAETVIVTSGITTMTKATSRRVRPYAYDPEVSLEFKLQKNTRKSFYSGHTSHVASLSFLTASIFEDLYPDSPWKPVVWITAIAAPAVTAVARVKGGRHFPTDVIVGYGVGALIGYYIPKLHKVQQDSPMSIMPNGLGARLTYVF